MKTSKKIMTKLDGLQTIEFWDESEFHGRETIITGLDENFRPVGERTVIPIPDSEIICDFCNEGITEFPVSVMSSYALCPECYKEVIK